MPDISTLLLSNYMLLFGQKLPLISSEIRVSSRDIFLLLLWNSSCSAIDSLPESQPSWLADAYAAYRDRLTDNAPGYPCHFGVHGHREANNWFTAVHQPAGQHTDDTAAVQNLAEALRAFRERAWKGPRRQTLLVFAGPPDPDPDLARDEQRFWDLLAGLTMADRRPWPQDRPRDAADPRWEWCFDGEPWFVFGCSPAYLHRRSRNLGPCLILVFQVRRVFEGLSGATLAGQTAKRHVREGLLRYDTVPPHPHLGDDQHSSVFKWRQYLLPDDQSVRDPGECPFPAALARRAALRVP